MARLPTGIVAAGLIRAAEAVGGNGVVLARGDPDSGALLLVMTCRGKDAVILERVSSLDGGLRWNRRKSSESVDSQTVARLVAENKRFDRDLWVLELDVADVEQFIVESLAET